MCQTADLTAATNYRTRHDQTTEPPRVVREVVVQVSLSTTVEQQRMTPVLSRLTLDGCAGDRRSQTGVGQERTVRVHPKHRGPPQGV